MLLAILLATLPRHPVPAHTFNHDGRQHSFPDEFHYELHARNRRDNTEYLERTDDALKSIGNETDCHQNINHENCTLTQNYIDADHRYYMSRYYPQGQWLFRDLSSNPPSDLKVEKHERLSNSYKKAFRIPIDFHFPFYGNFVDRIVVTTGGFINIGPQFHSFVHRVHYIAPLMADFNPASNNRSIVYIGKSDSVVIVQWNDFFLDDQRAPSKSFTFQVHLYKNGTIVLAYKNIPIPPSEIRPPHGNVAVIAGFSDGFIITYRKHEKFRLIVHNLIYSYHKVNLPLNRIRNGAGYRLTLLPNCIQFTTCSACLTESRRITNFTCRWCPKLQQCSDMLDWHRQNWVRHCSTSAYRDPDLCVRDREITRKFSKLKKENDADETDTGSASTIGIVVGMLLFIGLVVGISVGAYAYTHPQSKAGLFLIENRRPWKRFNENNNADDYAQLCTATVT